MPLVADPIDVETLYRSLLSRWNERDATGFGELFTEDGSLVGFDGTAVESRSSITEHLQAIFTDHQPASFVPKVREIRELGPNVVLLRSVVGMVPPGASDIEPAVNAVQALTAVHTGDGWRVAHFHNTPAALHGQPEAADVLTSELRAVLAASD
jgi:uncharacterized protein (TIGR02246 family)